MWGGVSGSGKRVIVPLSPHLGYLQSKDGDHQSLYSKQQPQAGTV